LVSENRKAHFNTIIGSWQRDGAGHRNRLAGAFCFADSFIGGMVVYRGRDGPVVLPQHRII
jgi:hypothetical protein